MSYSLSHLKALEAESIHIIREVAAEFRNPVMLYSIGKDSSVMVRLAEKAFAPGKVPFPLMHIDSKWKFREMVEFRDAYAKEHNWNLIVEYNKKVDIIIILHKNALVNRVQSRNILIEFQVHYSIE